jgi:hypothetical protein
MAGFDKSFDPRISAFIRGKSCFSPCLRVSVVGVFTYQISEAKIQELYYTEHNHEKLPPLFVELVADDPRPRGRLPCVVST